MKLLTFIRNLWAILAKRTVAIETKILESRSDNNVVPTRLSLFNDGVNGIPKPLPTDWIRGKESGIVENVRNTSGDWRRFTPPGETQQDMRTYFDSEACMSFAELDDIETQIAFLIAVNGISDANIQWLKDNGYIVNGVINFSDRFTAKMSGTTRQGNFYQSVWGSARNDGLVPESAWPFPFADLTSGGETDANWAVYYAEIPQSVKDLALEFKKRFTVMYEWVNETGVAIDDSILQTALKMSPLQIATLVCMPWFTTEIIPGCGPGAQHSTLLLAIDDTCRYILDHYVPFLKRLAKDYVVSYAVRGVIIEAVDPKTPPKFHHTFAKQFHYGDTDPEIILIQNIMKIGGYFPLTVTSSGYFGDITAASVKKLQDAYGILPDSPHDIGPRTLALLNQVEQSQ